MNIFAAQFLNTLTGLNAGALLDGALTSNDGAGSPFALLVKQGGEQDGSAKPVSGLLQNNKGFAQIDKDGNATDLSSPDLLLSDLLAVNIQALQNGDSITLPSGWTLSSDQSGLLSLANPDGNIAFPSFTKDQLQDLLTAYKNPDIFFPLNAKNNASDETESTAETTAVKKENTTPEKVNASFEISQPKLQKEAAQIEVANKILITPLSSQTITTNNAGVAPSPIVTTTSTINPLQPLWNAVIESQQRDAYLYAPTSVYASAGSARGVIAPANSNTGQIIASLSSTTTVKSIEGSAPNSTSPLLLTEETSLLSFDHIDELLTDAASIPAMMQQQGIRVSNDGNLVGTQPLAPAQLYLFIQKMAERNDTRTLTVRLDPPELGRVQVSLSSGADKIVRAHILVERPEALTLLKRDMASLEKALQGAGISLDGDSVSMDLAGSSGDQGGFAQQAFMDMWSENNESRLAQTGAELAVGNIEAADDVADINEFYQSDTAVNIKV